MKKTKLDEKQLPKKIGPTKARTKALPGLLTESTFDRINFRLIAPTTLTIKTPLSFLKHSENYNRCNVWRQLTKLTYCNGRTKVNCFKMKPSHNFAQIEILHLALWWDSNQGLFSVSRSQSGRTAATLSCVVLRNAAWRHRRRCRSRPLRWKTWWWRHRSDATGSGPRTTATRCSTWTPSSRPTTTTTITTSTITTPWHNTPIHPHTHVNVS